MRNVHLSVDEETNNGSDKKLLQGFEEGRGCRSFLVVSNILNSKEYAIVIKELTLLCH